MVEKDKVVENAVRRTGIFDFKELYRFCYTWLADEGYFVEEKKYTEKVKGDSKEIEIEWSAKRKISDYFRFAIKITWKIIGMTDVEVDKGGKRVKMNKGDVTIKVSGILEKDYENRWETAAYLKFLRGVYDKYIIRPRVEQYEDKLFEEVDEFIAQTKAFLAIEAKR